jgi:hypothetical protein
LVAAVPVGLHYLGAFLEPSYPWAGWLTRYLGYSREEVSLVVLAFCFAQTDTRPATVFCDELDTGLFEGGPHVFERTRIWLSRAPFKVRNCLGGCFAGSRKIRLGPPQEAASATALRRIDRHF